MTAIKEIIANIFLGLGTVFLIEALRIAIFDETGWGGLLAILLIFYQIATLIIALILMLFIKNKEKPDLLLILIMRVITLVNAILVMTIGVVVGFDDIRPILVFIVLVVFQLLPLLIFKNFPIRAPITDN
jgi:hypothetical protein